MLKKHLLFILIFLFAFISVARADTINFPYLKVYQNLMPADDPLPGFGDTYAALGKGIKSVLWNPAGLLSGPTAEASLILTSSGSLRAYKNQAIDDYNLNSGQTSNGISTYVYFTDNLAITSPESRTIRATADYATDSGSLGYEFGLITNDWLAFGVRKGTASDLNLSIAGSFPSLLKMNINLKGQSASGMTIDTTGKLNYINTVEGTTYQYETSQPLWSGFLTQEVMVPSLAFTDMLNSLNVTSDFTLTAAARGGPLQFGVNIIPVSANAVVDNNIKVITTTRAQDQVFYTPDFDPSDENAVAAWMFDPSLYGTENGYTAGIIRVPTGDIIGDGRYKGTYTGTTTRFDFGAIYEPNDIFSLGLALENLNGAVLNLQGKGLVSIFTTKISTTAATPSFTPGTSLDWEPISNSSQVVSGTENYGLESQKSFELPKRMRFGIALKKPFLIALDYEQQQSNIKVQTNTANGPVLSRISNLQIVRLGLESQLLVLPVWLRMGLGLLLKPQVTGDPSLVQSVKDLYTTYPVLPSSFNLGLVTKIWGVEIGDTLEIEPASLINLYQVDTINPNNGKTVFSSFYLKKDNWKFNYLLNLDLAQTYTAYTNSGKSSGNFNLGDLRWNSAYVITYEYKF